MKRTTQKLIFGLSVAVLVLMVLFVAQSCNNVTKKPKAKYVFYLIGDGMGLAQASAAEAYLSAVNGEIGFTKLNLSKLPVQSFFTTFSEDDFITCSAASGTALATGYKVNNGVVSMNSELSESYKTIAEEAKQKNMKVGIVTSVSLDHATPAVFYAHQPSRNEYFEIAMQLAESNFDFFAGGGFRGLYGEIDGEPVNIIDEAQKNGFHYINSKDEFYSLKQSDGPCIAVNPVLTGGEALPYAINMTENDITLAEFTEKAIEMLDNDNGFFLMVEGGKIDWACHSNDAATVVKEVLAFDEAVGVALDFYEKYPEETLILVFADHETGGMALGANGMNYGKAFRLLQYQQGSIDVFAEMVANYRNENGEDADFDEMMDIITDFFGLNNDDIPLNDNDIAILKESFNQSMIDPALRNRDAGSQMLYSNMDPLSVTASKMLGRIAGIGWTTFSHSAIPVPIRAIGAGAEYFEGYFDNTDIPKRTLEVIK